MLITSGVATWEYYAYTTGAVPPLDPNNVLKEQFRLISFAMALLLTFRVQRCYERWREARDSMSSVVR